MKIKKYTLLLLPALLALGACKPTERNYQTAYDKAYQAAQRKAAEMSTGAEGVQLESLDGPRLEVVDGENLYVSPARVKPFEADSISWDGGNVGIAVARYSMPTNARRHLADLKSEYPEAFIAYDGEDNYYVVVQMVVAVPEAATPLRTFREAHPGYAYIGLPSGPLVLIVNK